MRRWILWTLLAIGNVSGGAIQAQQSSPPESTGAVPFELVSDFLVIVNGGVGNLEGLRFIVDTGSTWSAIDQKVADRLQLKRRAGQIMNFDRFIPVEWTEVNSLRVGPIHIEAARVMVINLAKYSEFAKNVDGIIGLDLLSRNEKLAIDYARRTLYFEAADNQMRNRSVPGGFLATIVVQGVPVRLCVDTGSRDILLFESRLKRNPIRIRTEGEPKAITMGRVQGTKVTLPGVQIGGPEELITAILIDGPRERDMPGVDGYLGVASLHAKRIEFDFEKMELHWQ